MEPRKILAHVDHTQLMPAASWEDIKTLCDEALYYGTASVCIPPSYVRQAAQYLGDRLPVCTVIGFPNGYNTTSVKVSEVRQAIADGAKEVDMVINIGWVKDGKFDAVTEEIRALKEAAGGHILKVIIETGYLTDGEKVRLCGCVTDAGADYIKTCTGFGPGKATGEDIDLISKNIGRDVKIKASAGIKELEQGEIFLKMGVDRLGASGLIKAAREQGTR